MKLIILFIVIIQLVLLYKIINLNIEPFERKMTDAEKKLRRQQFLKDNQAKNKELERELQKNRGNNARVIDYTKLDKLLEMSPEDRAAANENEAKKTNKKPKKQYKFNVFGYFRLQGDSTKLTEKDGKEIKNTFCKLLEVESKACNIDIKRDFYIHYNVDMIDVNIEDIKNKLKVNKKIGKYKIIQASLPSVKDIGIKVRKNSKNTPNPDKPRNQEDEMVDYYDWTMPLTRPAACSPPQKYDNTPFVEYQLTNGTPLSFLDETKVGFILPKFYYQQY